jgi:multiple sugar transport system substrate-binding protein
MHSHWLVAAVSASLALAGCSAPVMHSATAKPTEVLASNQQITLRWDSYNFGAPGIGGKAIQTIIDEFQAKYPNITIEGHNIPSAAVPMMSAVTTEIAGGNAPDIAQLPLQNVDSVISEMGALPIDQFAPKAEFDETMNHILLPARQLGERNGHLYASPFTFSTPTLFYNADIFSAAGLDPNTPPATWEQVRTYGLQIKDKTDTAPLNIAGVGLGMTWISQSLLSSNGAGILSPDKKTAIFNQPAAMETYQWWRGLVTEGVHPMLNSADAQSAFLNGNLAMYLNSTALLNAAESAAEGKFTVKTAIEPAFTGKPVHPTNSGSGLFVFTKDPARQYAAWQFLRFAASQRGFTIITSMIGYVPQRDDEAAQNVAYGGQDAQQTMDAAASRVTARLLDA